MIKTSLTIASILILASHSIAADISLEWDASKDATGYKLQISTDTAHGGDPGYREHHT